MPGGHAHPLCALGSVLQLLIASQLLIFFLFFSFVLFLAAPRSMQDLKFPDQ